ncbi:MAG: oxidoreductase [Lutibacter sp.]|uniref:sialidase family protein n=1 Tax=Lutibacter sp. TaxID=1925666 RepID=UPI001840B01C|nr:oxidoreductase [Lutibacter sp.]MBT8317867.1 oxidoreductase [Lutibacter sp.]NNJ58725.1 oxidoreductase [Lutibacter sp.]
MNRLTACFIILISIASCKKEYKSRESVTISIEKFKMDSTSIRAIEILNDSAVVYAGSVGDIGILLDNGNISKFKKIITDSVAPHFRALALNKKSIYALNVGNPALLYKIESSKATLVYTEYHEKVFYDSMKFFDNMNGIAMGDPTGDCLSIIITRDGGNSWFKIDCNNLPQIYEGEAAFAASNTNIAIVGENAWIATGGLKSRIFHTSDMGVTWNVYNTPIIQGENTTGIYSIDFYNEKQGIICGGDYTDKFGNSANKAITNDGGKTWQVVSENKEPKYVSCVQFVPKTDGKEVFAVSTNGIFYSNDAGVNWEKVSDDGFYTIRFVSDKSAWLSGNEVIAKMTIN